MKKIFLISLLLCQKIIVAAQMPERSFENIQKYTEICRQHIYINMKGMYRESGGSLKYPFLAPGSNQYLDQLWDWDSWLSNIALRQILVENGTNDDRKQALKYEQGCVLNALNYGGMDGWIPICISRNTPDRNEILRDINPWKSNMHKPTLAQHAAFIVKNMNGDAEWLREDFYTLQAFVNKYLNFHRHKATGLLYWENDEMIGVDDDPCTFYRPQGSSGSIFLNALMYKELQAICYLADCLHLSDVAVRYRRAMKLLKAAIQEHCWDPRDGFYYSVDLNLLPIEKPASPGFHLHSGQPRNYDCLIQRISGWGGFMAMWAGIATPEQAKEIVERQYRNPQLFNAAAGVYSLSPLEKMYDIRATGNPSSWQGPVWGCINYLVFRGLVQYGYVEEARELAEKTIILFGYDFERFGALHEYYSPDSGEPILNKGFQNWNFLVLNMIAWLENKTIITEF
ncbi:trehalase family glycosidase [Bacteroides acidifaciens]|jgi:putative isomerase|uniref:MGH1-like glycoside hydrolase domain-containing protein n=1 Tax=Bacteroides acidifaciens TaxID=85831 RepID=UPI00257064EA|nr:trehalase family glycosidase [Bacteroides acidifaciens]